MRLHLLRREHRSPLPALIVTLGLLALAGCGHDGGGGDLAAPPDLGGCATVVAGGPAFGAPAVISDPANASFVPSVATRGDVTVVAWHEFPIGGSAKRVRWVAIGPGGCVGEARRLDTAVDRSRPQLVATAAGFYLAYQASPAGGDEVHGQALDAAGAIVGGDEALGPGAMPRAAAAGDDVAIAWTDGTHHHFARRGTVETVPDTVLPTALVSTGLLNFPRVAIGAQRELFFAWRDGPSASDLDVYVALRPVGGALGAAANVSQAPGYLDDDVALAVEPDGSLDVVWVQQDRVDVMTFEVVWSRRAPDGSFTAIERFGTQGLWTWTPSVVPGPQAVWNAGAAGVGALYFFDGIAAPIELFAGVTGSAAALARAADGALHLAFTDGETPRRVRYARRP